MVTRLNNCKCGTPVEVRYLAGVGVSLRHLVNNRFVQARPVYYIECPTCGNALSCAIMSLDEKGKKAARTRLLNYWNGVTK